MTFFRAASYGSPGPGPTERGPSLLYLSVLCALCGWLFSCAAQAPPQPPRLERPQAITDLTAHQVGQTIEISFTLPTLATDGERLTKPIEAEIFRSFTGKTLAVPTGIAGAIYVDSGPAPEVAGKGPWAHLNGAELTNLMRGPTVVYKQWFPVGRLAQLTGRETVFEVRTYTRGFRGKRFESEDSNNATIAALDVTGPVEDLKIETTQSVLKLSWRAPVHTLTGHPPYELDGYHVYRSESGKPGTYQLLGETLAPAFSDPKFQFGQTYFYEVRAVFKEDGQTAESADSRPVAVTPRDVFPPAAPAALTALYSPGVVELIWNANTESDLAGYNVYRMESSGEFRRLNPSLVPTPIYRDSSVAAGHDYSYRVTAVDSSGNESAPGSAVEVETR